jgi:nucleotide-binding universal stress UspA family protein
VGHDARIRREQAYLDGLVRRLEKVTSVPVTAVLTKGREVGAALCEEAGTATDLVVMATHGRGPLGRLWHGGVADALMRRLTAPLLLVRGYDAPVDLTGDPVARHVLIPLDGSEVAERALGPAVALGTLTGADHTLLRVIRPVADHPVASGGPDLKGPPGERVCEEAQDYLLRVVERLAGHTRRVHPWIVLSEDTAARAILRHAESHDIDLIALTASDRGRLSRLFRGSVADQVVRRASAAVLVVGGP